MFKSLLTVTTLLALLALACSDDDGDTSTKLSVVATTTQIGDFARNVGGDRIELNTLLKANQDAHDFEPEPSQVRALSGADLVLTNGVGLDSFVEKAAASGEAMIIDLSQGISLLEGGHTDEEAGEDEGESESEGKDPHIWFSVPNAIKMVESLRDALAEADQANAGYYASNADSYIASLRSLDTDIRSQVAQIPAGCRKLVTNHDVLSYYGQTYGLTVVGSVIPSSASNAQPSAADVASIVNAVKSENVPAIFAEASINPALIRQVGREAGVKVVDDLYGDSLGPSGTDGATYLSMMQSDTTKIVEALKSC